MSTWIVTYERINAMGKIEAKIYEFEGSDDDVDRWLGGGMYIQGLIAPPVDVWELISYKKKRGGKRPGAGGKGGSPATYGCTTKTVRVPVAIADLIPTLIKNLESLENIVALYDEQVEASTARTNRGQPSIRYEKLNEFLNELQPEIELIREINSRLGK